MRALRTLSAGNRMLLRASDESELLHGMCRVIVDDGGYRAASVAYAQTDDSKSIKFAAFALPAGYSQVETNIENAEANLLSWGENAYGSSAIGIAIRTGKPCVGRNLRTDPDHAVWREYSLRVGYESVTAFPLAVDGEVIGALTMCAAEPDAFDDDEVRLLNELADDLAYGIANLRSRVKRREAEATIERMAYYDPLTGLPNRAHLRDALFAAIAAAKESRQPLALLLLNVGHLQEINDTLGYAQGDRLLTEVATRLLGAAREAESVCRVGEAEFAVLLRGGGADYGIRIAQRLIATLAAPLEISEIRVDTRPTIGISLFPGHGGEPDVLIRRARVAMTEARRASAGYAVFSISAEQECGRRLALMGDLRRAIERNELALHLQPKVDIVSRHVCGAEALVRWQHPALGTVPTGEFVKLAEHAGLITSLTQWVLDAAFGQRYAGHEVGLDQPLAVNLSAHDLRDPTLVDRIQGLFATWGAEPDWIQFELTETALMEDPAAAVAVLAALKRLDVKIAVDDFGMGCSSLSYLQRLPIDAIKIDQSFVMPLETSQDSAAIVHSIIELGHDLKLEVVAEGVESEGIWRRLADLSCDTAQGYYVGVPIPAEQFKEWRDHCRW